MGIATRPRKDQIASATFTFNDGVVVVFNYKHGRDENGMLYRGCSVTVTGPDNDPSNSEFWPHNSDVTQHAKQTNAAAFRRMYRQRKGIKDTLEKLHLVKETR